MGYRTAKTAGMTFLSTLSLRRATPHRMILKRPQNNFYPRSPCGERRFRYRWPCGDCGISIHALLAESDIQTPRGCVFKTISIHALLAESDFAGVSIRCLDAISIHALLAESDWACIRCWRCFVYFYPRSPCGERRGAASLPYTQGISIHALLAESDVPRVRLQVWPQPYFYPRSPCGERPEAFGQVSQMAKISIHALLAESDAPLLNALLMLYKFLSTLSLRRATNTTCKQQIRFGISIHALLAESDWCSLLGYHLHRISIHALLAESDPP